MARQRQALGDELAVGVAERGRVVHVVLEHARIGRAEDGQRHLVGDREDRVPEQLEDDRIGLGRHGSGGGEGRDRAHHSRKVVAFVDGLCETRACSEGSASREPTRSREPASSATRGLSPNDKGGLDMAQWTPDPTFYPSPRLATRAPAEKLAYVAEFDPERKKPDRLAVVDLDPSSSSYATDRQPDRGRHGRRRAAPLRLERLQLVSVPERAPSARRAALSGRAGAALVQHPHPGHQARPEGAEAGQDGQGGGDRRARRLFQAAHGPLRAGWHLRDRARQRRRQGAGRHLPDGPRDLRGPRPLGDRPRPAVLRLRHVVASRPRHAS